MTDCIATSVVIIGLLISASTGVQIDGWLGVCVSLFILFTGVSTFRESLSPLLGKAPDPEFVDDMDPIASNDAFTNELKMKVEEGLCELNPEYSIHDFRIVKGSTHTNVVFDMVIPYGLDLTERQIKQSAIEKIKSIDEKLYPIINVEKSLSD